MGEIDTVFQVPFIFRALCYLGGMALFLSELTWLWFKAGGAKASERTLSANCGLWILRLLAAVSVLSLLVTGFGARAAYEFFPEVSILLLLAVLHRLSSGNKPLEKRASLLREGLMSFLVLGFSLLGWIISAALGWGIFQMTNFFLAPPWVAIFVMALLWNVSLVVLFLKRKQQDKTLKFQGVLWPVLLAYFLIMLPDFVEHLGNSVKFQEMLKVSLPPRSA